MFETRSEVIELAVNDAKTEMNLVDTLKRRVLVQSAEESFLGSKNIYTKIKYIYSM